ncbi:hypothetical protein BDV06DRAFT_221194 [Aspergillus oleicola]
MTGPRKSTKCGNKGRERAVSEDPNALGEKGIAQAVREEGGRIPDSAREVARHLEILRAPDWSAHTGKQATSKWFQRLALVLQRRGDLASQACERCSQNPGAFESCVVGPALGGQAFQCGACANCIWQNRARSCSFFVKKGGLAVNSIRKFLHEGEYSLREAITREEAGVQQREHEEYIETDHSEDEDEDDGQNQHQQQQQQQPQPQPEPEPEPQNTDAATFFGAFEPGQAFTRVGHSQRGPRCFFDGEELHFPISREIWRDVRRLITARSDLAHFASIVDARLYEMGSGEGGDDYLFWKSEGRRLPNRYPVPTGRGHRRPTPRAMIESSSVDSGPSHDGSGNGNFQIQSSSQTPRGQGNMGQPGPSQASQGNAQFGPSQSHPTQPSQAPVEEFPDGQPSLPRDVPPANERRRKDTNSSESNPRQPRPVHFSCAQPLDKTSPNPRRDSDFGPQVNVEYQQGQDHDYEGPRYTDDGDDLSDYVEDNLDDTQHYPDPRGPSDDGWSEMEEYDEHGKTVDGGFPYPTQPVQANPAQGSQQDMGGLPNWPIQQPNSQWQSQELESIPAPPKLVTAPYNTYPDYERYRPPQHEIQTRDSQDPYASQAASYRQLVHEYPPPREYPTYPPRSFIPRQLHPSIMRQGTPRPQVGTKPVIDPQLLPAQPSSEVSDFNESRGPIHWTRPPRESQELLLTRSFSSPDLDVPINKPQTQAGEIQETQPGPQYDNEIGAIITTARERRRVEAARRESQAPEEAATAATARFRERQSRYRDVSEIPETQQVVQEREDGAGEAGRERRQEVGVQRKGQAITRDASAATEESLRRRRTSEGVRMTGKKSRARGSGWDDYAEEAGRPSKRARRSPDLS